jgi:hypothetical protein
MHQPCQACHRHHHGAKQRHLPAQLHHTAPPRPRCTMLPSLANFDALDAHHSTTRLHQSAAAPKNDALKREHDTDVPPSSDPGVWSLGFPPRAAWVDKQRLQWRCLHQGNGTWAPPSPAMTNIRAQISLAAMPLLPRHRYRWTRMDRATPTHQQRDTTASCCPFHVSPTKTSKTDLCGL